MARATRKARVLDQDGAVVASARIAPRTLGGDLPVCKGTRGAARGCQGGKSFFSSLVSCAQANRRRSPIHPTPPTGRLLLRRLVIPIQLSRDATPSLQLRNTAVKMSKVGTRVESINLKTKGIRCSRATFFAKIGRRGIQRDPFLCRHAPSQPYPQHRVEQSP